MMRNYDKKFRARFWSKVDKATECWVWTASRSWYGYGQIAYGRRGMDKTTLRANRVSYELRYGAIPKGLWVLHHCDSPACVRPSHLFLGTQADNMADAASKGRMARGPINGNAKLTERDVHNIRMALAKGETQKQIARCFGVRRQCISKIKTGERWNWLA